MATEEEARAAAYQLRYGRLRAFRAQMRARLSGNPAAYRALLAKTEPLIKKEIEDGDQGERLPEHANG